MNPFKRYLSPEEGGGTGAPASDQAPEGDKKETGTILKFKGDGKEIALDISKPEDSKRAQELLAMGAGGQRFVRERDQARKDLEAAARKSEEQVARYEATIEAMNAMMERLGGAGKQEEVPDPAQDPAGYADYKVNQLLKKVNDLEGKISVKDREAALKTASEARAEEMINRVEDLAGWDPEKGKAANYPSLTRKDLTAVIKQVYAGEDPEEALAYFEDLRKDANATRDERLRKQAEAQKAAGTGSGGAGVTRARVSGPDLKPGMTFKQIRDAALEHQAKTLAAAAQS